MSKTIGLELVRNFIKYVLYSGFVKNAVRPVSGLIVADPERAKSTEVKTWHGLGVRTLQDLTAYGLATEIRKMSEKDREIFHHIIIPDLERLKARSRNVREELLSTFRIVMDEGLQSVSTAYIKLDLDNPVRLGILMCTTPDDLGDKRSVFRTLSFQSRVLPFTYDFNDALKLKILEFVETEEHIIQERHYFKREEKSTVVLPKHYARALNSYAKLLSRRLERFSKTSSMRKTEAQRLVGVRPKENLMTLLKAIALYHGCTTVRKEHFKELQELYNFMNYDFRKIKPRKAGD